jgi:hypothetical protein
VDAKYSNAAYRRNMFFEVFFSGKLADAVRMNRRMASLVIGFVASLTVAWAETYYVDGESGDDTNDGIARERAWRSLRRVNQQTFEPGDKLLFRAGTRFSGQLKPQGSGEIRGGKPAPIMIGMYGRGPLPRIDCEGRYLDALLLRNVEYWEVQDLEITNLGESREPWRTGVRIASDGFGKMRHIHLRNLYVHDVNGDLRKEQEGCGIFFESRGGDDSHFDDLLIENCHVVRTDRNGICQRASGRARSLNVVIRGNLLEDIGGEGIKIWGSNGALVERNIVRGGRMRCEDHAAGIWPWASDDTLVQFNEVSGMKGTKDGQGFDSDYRCRRSVFQYNYSHDNEGGFFLICSPGNSYCEDTVIRYNISQNDGTNAIGTNTSRIIHFGGGASNTLVYNNTIYVRSGLDLPMILCTEWSGGNAQGTWFYNNIFYVDGRVTYDLGKSTDMVFENNVFCGNHIEPPADSGAITNCPPLLKPGSGGSGLDALDGYRPQTGAPFPSGRVVLNNGGRDFFGTPIPLGLPPSVGAAERIR